MTALADNKTPTSLVVGLGQTGFSVARHLLSQGEAVSVVDSREPPPLLDRLRQDLPEAVWLGRLPRTLPTGCHRIVVSPGVASDLPLLAAAREAGIEVLGDVELFARLSQAPMIGVTGSNGKSTVVSMLGQMAAAGDRRVTIGGNIGRPVLDLLEEETDLFVLELSSFQLESTYELDAEVGVVLNLSEDHLDRHHGMDQYAAAKARLVHQSRVAVLNRDDPWVRAMAGEARQVIWFGAGEPGAGEFGLRRVGDGEWFARGEELLAPVDRLALAGRHNHLNVLAGLAALEALDIALEPALDRLAGYTGLPHRMALVGEADGVRWINDSKATNLGATLAALQGLSAPVVLIAGGQGKGQDFTALTAALSDSARALVVMGEAANELLSVAPRNLPARRVAGMEEAVAAARELARPGDTVLLSPACASFDLFEGFAHRGDAFVHAVQASGVVS